MKITRLLFSKFHGMVFSSHNAYLLAFRIKCNYISVMTLGRWRFIITVEFRMRQSKLIAVYALNGVDKHSILIHLYLTCLKTI